MSNWFGRYFWEAYILQKEDKTYQLNACSRCIKMKGRFTFFIDPAIIILHFRKLAKSLLACSTHPFPFVGGLKGNLLLRYFSFGETEEIFDGYWVGGSYGGYNPT